MKKLALLTLVFSGLVLGGCGASSEGSNDDEASALRNEGPSGNTQRRSFSFDGEFTRGDCVQSGTHSPAACGGNVSAGRGSFTVELLDAPPSTIARDDDSSKVRAKISVKAPGILPGDAAIDVSFETELKAWSWGRIYGADYQVLGQIFKGSSPRETFANNPVFDGNRTVTVGAEMMQGGKVKSFAIDLTYTQDLDHSTSIGFKAATE